MMTTRMDVGGTRRQQFKHRQIFPRSFVEFCPKSSLYFTVATAPLGDDFVPVAVDGARLISTNTKVMAIPPKIVSRGRNDRVVY